MRKRLYYQQYTAWLLVLFFVLTSCTPPGPLSQTSKAFEADSLSKVIHLGEPPKSDSRVMVLSGNFTQDDFTTQDLSGAPQTLVAIFNYTYPVHGLPGSDSASLSTPRRENATPKYILALSGYQTIGDKTFPTKAELFLGGLDFETRTENDDVLHRRLVGFSQKFMSTDGNSFQIDPSSDSFVNAGYSYFKQGLLSGSHTTDSGQVLDYQCKQDSQFTSNNGLQSGRNVVTGGLNYTPAEGDIPASLSVSVSYTVWGRAWHSSNYANCPLTVYNNDATFTGSVSFSTQADSPPPEENDVCLKESEFTDIKSNVEGIIQNLDQMIAFSESLGTPSNDFNLQALTGSCISDGQGNATCQNYYHLEKIIEQARAKLTAAENALIDAQIKEMYAKEEVIKIAAQEVVLPLVILAITRDVPATIEISAQFGVPLEGLALINGLNEIGFISRASLFLGPEILAVLKESRGYFQNLLDGLTSKLGDFSTNPALQCIPVNAPSAQAMKSIEYKPVDTGFYNQSKNELSKSIKNTKKKTPKPSNLKWGNPKSVPTYGHSFNQHGQKTKIQSLRGRAASTKNDQGRWGNDQEAADLLTDIRDELQVGGQQTARPLPLHLQGREVTKPDGSISIEGSIVVKPDGTVVPATHFIPVPDAGGGYKTSYPVVLN